MRKLVVASIVLTLLFLVSIGDASAAGWRGSWHHARRYVRPHSTVAVSHAVVAQPTAATKTPVADSDQVEAAAQMDESAAMCEVIGVMQGMLRREYSRIQWEIQMRDAEPFSISYDSD